MLLPPAQTSVVSPAASLTSLRSETLANGLHLEFFDHSNRYFGDYHRLCIEVRSSLSLGSASLQGVAPDLLDRARARFGATLTVTRSVERMGVAGAQVDALTLELIEGVLLEAQRYLARPDYPARLLSVELARKPASSSRLQRS